MNNFSLVTVGTGTLPPTSPVKPLCNPQSATRWEITADVHGCYGHLLYAIAATNALVHRPDIAKVQEWLGHTNVLTIRMEDKRRRRPEESPTFTVEY